MWTEYMSVVRSVITYPVDTAPDTSKTLKHLEINEIKRVTTILGNRVQDRVRSEEIGCICRVKT